MSLGSDLDDFGNKSTSMSVIDQLQAAGTQGCISAGNGGKGLLYRNDGFGLLFGDFCICCPVRTAQHIHPYHGKA